MGSQHAGSALSVVYFVRLRKLGHGGFVERFLLCYYVRSWLLNSCENLTFVHLAVYHFWSVATIINRYSLSAWLQVEEHLLLYARIKGVREDLLSKVAGDKMEQMDLCPFKRIKARASHFLPQWSFGMCWLSQRAKVAVSSLQDALQ